MLRTSFLHGKSMLIGPARVDLRASVFSPSRALPRRWFADRKTLDNAVLPGSLSQTPAASDIPPAPVILTSSLPKIVAPPTGTENIPRAPPTPQQVGADLPASTVPKYAPSAGEATPPPAQAFAKASPSLPPTAALPATPAPKPKRRRGRKFLIFLLTSLVLGYAGGTYMSLINDNFHDFFTEYVPYGEDAVLYFEEREFRRRFPRNSPTSSSSAGQSKLYPQTSGEHKISVPAKSGVSARNVVDPAKGSDLGGTGRHLSAVEDKAATPAKPAEVPVQAKPAVKQKPQAGPPAAASEERLKVKEAGKQQARGAKSGDEEPKTISATPAAAPATTATTTITAPPVPPPTTAFINPLQIENAGDPIVQELAKILNDIIAVVNADNASSKYETTMTKAKDDLKRLAGDVSTMRATETLAAEKKIRDSQVEFDNGARELVKRIEQEMKDQEIRWREEYEAERERIAVSYQNKLKSEAEAAEKLAAQHLRNALMEQERKIKDSFTTSIRDRVETERGGRLSKLGELSSTVHELQKLITKSNEVVDTNLRTQHLVVAVDAVRHVIETSDRPRPFLHELAALKEIANEDPVVNAAIASLNPADYQRGIATPAQLIDRFRSVANEVRKASLLPENAGVASHVASLALSKLTFKKQGLAPGDDVESVLARTETFLEEGNLDDATREMNALKGWAKILSHDWLNECRRVLEVRQALDVMTTEARLQSLLVE